MTREAVIVSTARTPLAKSWRGAFNMTHGATLGGHVVKAALERAKVEPAEVEDVLMGCAFPEGATGSNIARQIALRAGCPASVPGATVNRFCSSGLQTIAMAAQRIIAGEGEIFVAGGLEAISVEQNEVNAYFVKEAWLDKHQPDIYWNMRKTAEEVAKRFASFDREPAPKPQAAMFGNGGSRVVHRDLEQAHLTLALEGVPQTDLSLFSLQVFTNTLGGGMSSRLFQEVREKRGLCYSIYAFHAPYTDTGFFGLYTGNDPADAPEMMEVVVDVINESVETLTEAEVARAKAQMKAGLLMALESCSSRAEQLARHVLAYGRPQTVEELVSRIDAVSVESTRNAARALLARSRPAVVALGSGRGLDTAVNFAEGLTKSKSKAQLH